MATINDLLYHYQDTNEFVCSDGRMSVNGICKVKQPDSVDTAKITKEIIDQSGSGEGDGKIDLEKEKEIKDKQILEDLEGETDYFPDLGKEKKGKFEWDMDKESKIENYKNTISDNINAYNNFIEENLGITSEIQTAARVGGTLTGIAQGGILMAVAPWAIPVLAGGAINNAERERIEELTEQDKQGDINTVDMMSYNAPKPGDEGFNIHRDEPDFRNTNQDQGVTADEGFDQSSVGGYQQSRGSHHF